MMHRWPVSTRVGAEATLAQRGKRVNGSTAPTGPGSGGTGSGETGSGSSGQGGSGGQGRTGTPGGPGDALTAFLAAARQLSATTPIPDPNVFAAVALGWSLGDALAWATHGQTKHLAEVPELTTTAGRWSVLVDQILARAQQLHTHLAASGGQLDLTDQLAAAVALRLDAGGAAAIPAKLDALTALHESIVAVLWSAETALGKAYVLGHRLQEMCAWPAAASAPHATESISAHWEDVHRDLLRLASQLPANAAHAVDNSLRLWRGSLAGGGQETADDLLRQGWRWREVLAGEVAAKDGLRLSDYVGAAGGVARQLRDLARHAIQSFAIWLVLAVVAVAVGIYLLAQDSGGSTGAGVVTVATALGLTWKGVGEFFGRAAATSEEELWNAELDWAIAYRFTMLRNPPSTWQLRRYGGGLETDLPTKQHLRRFKEWKERWPDVE